MGFSSYPDYLEMIQNHGNAYIDPTALVDEEDFGSLLGFTKAGITFDPGYSVVSLTGEEDGQENQMKIFTGSRPRGVATFENFNTTSLAVFFPGCVDEDGIKIPGTIKAGQRIDTSNYHRFLFVPQNRSHPCLLGQKVQMSIIKTVDFSKTKNMGFTISIDFFRKTDDPDGTVFIGPIENAVLR